MMREVVVTGEAPLIFPLTKHRSEVLLYLIKRSCSRDSSENIII